MSNSQDSSRRRAPANATGDDGGRRSGVGQFTSQAASQLSEGAQRVAEQAKSAASFAASEAKEQATSYVNKQVGAGADLVAQVAHSMRSAADDLEQGVPMLAGLVRGAADRVDSFSDSIQDRSAAELFESAQAFTRRHPAIVLSTAAALGFVAYRLLAPTSDTSSDSDLGTFDNGSDPGSRRSESIPAPSLGPSAMEQPYGL